MYRQQIVFIVMAFYAASTVLAGQTQSRAKTFAEHMQTAQYREDQKRYTESKLAASTNLLRTMGAKLQKHEKLPIVYEETESTDTDWENDLIDTYFSDTDNSALGPVMDSPYSGIV
jgi:hypothetical protein